jgi:hypothetical protein
MSRNAKIKHVTPSLGVRILVRHIYKSWNEALQTHHGREGTWMPTPLRSDTQRIERDTLPATICLWVEELGIDNARETWEQLLLKVPTSSMIAEGYRNANPANLSWIFKNDGKGRGIDRILDGTYEMFKGGLGYDASEGI